LNLKAAGRTLAPSQRRLCKQTEWRLSKDKLFGEASLENRLRALVLALFAASAVLLACVGIYGTFSYSGALRGSEKSACVLRSERLPYQIVARFLVEAVRLTLLGCQLWGAPGCRKACRTEFSALDADPILACSLMILIG